MGNLITLDIELNAIRSFLSTVVDAASVEYSKIQSRSDAGEFNHHDDKDNALFNPMMWEEIACKATLGELNALFEWELHNVATVPFSKTRNGSGTTKPKIVSDLPVGQVITLIEEYYQIRINDVNSYDDVMDIRNKVNSFKPRKGFKHPLKDKCRVIPEKLELSTTDTFKSIDVTRKFIRDLWRRTKDKPRA
jgi:hypothetical protein